MVSFSSSSWWLNQPILEKYVRTILDHEPQGSGVKTKKMSCHHLVIFLSFPGFRILGGKTRLSFFQKTKGKTLEKNLDSPVST